MNAKRRRGVSGRGAPRLSTRREEGETTGAFGREPHGDRYGQLADWIGVSADGSGHADEVVGGIVGLRAFQWWTSRLRQRLQDRRLRRR
jgi:hypothetical protein